MNLADLRATSNLLANMDEEQFTFFESVATEVNLEPDEILFHGNDEADKFYIVITGILALEVERPAKPPTIIQTLGDDSIVGLSWRLPPHRRLWTARAVTETKLASLDASAVIAECKNNSDLDRHLWEIFAVETFHRLHHTRIQMLDLYGRG